MPTCTCTTLHVRFVYLCGRESQFVNSGLSLREKITNPRKQDVGSGTQRSPNGTEAYSDGNHNSHALSGDVNGGAATAGTMSLPLTPLVTDIQWPRWLKMGPAPKKRNGQSTWGLPRHMGGVRESARCPYGAAEPSWAMVRCISSSHPPILYTACVGFYNLSHVIH